MIMSKLRSDWQPQRSEHLGSKLALANISPHQDIVIFRSMRPLTVFTDLERTSQNMSMSVVITGCSAGGIGDSLAQEFYRRGFRVFATARNLGKVEHLRVIGCDIVQLDVTSKESIEKTVSEITKATGGKLDFLVNNAGQGKPLSMLAVN